MNHLYKYSSFEPREDYINATPNLKTVEDKTSEQDARFSSDKHSPEEKYNSKGNESKGNEKLRERLQKRLLQNYKTTDTK